MPAAQGRHTALAAVVLLVAFAVPAAAMSWVFIRMVVSHDLVITRVLGAVLLLYLIFGLVESYRRRRAAFSLRSMNALCSSSRTDPALHALLDRLCEVGGIAKPDVAVVTWHVPNAFLRGRRAGTELLCVTTGLLSADLEPDELAAVLAHELAHVAARDSVLFSAALTAVTAIPTLGPFPWRATRDELTQIGARAARQDAGKREGFRAWCRRAGEGAVYVVLILSVIVVHLVWLPLTLLAAIAGAAFGHLCRHRELAADWQGSLMTGKPSSLASALVKLDGRMGSIPISDIRHPAVVTTLAIMPVPMPDDPRKRRDDELPEPEMAHPPLGQRLTALADLSRRLGRTTG